MSQGKLKHVFWQETDTKGINARQEESVTTYDVGLCTLPYASLAAVGPELALPSSAERMLNFDDVTLLENCENTRMKLKKKKKFSDKHVQYFQSTVYNQNLDKSLKNHENSIKVVRDVTPYPLVHIYLYSVEIYQWTRSHT
jgi:hypothetical protein